MIVNNQTKAMAWPEMGKGVKWVANRLRVHLTTTGRLNLKIQRMGEDKGIRMRRGRQARPRRGILTYYRAPCYKAMVITKFLEAHKITIVKWPE